jgi:hypothetical protein
MRLIALLGLVFLPLHLYAQESSWIVWQPVQQLTFDHYDHGTPVVFAQDGIVHVLWAPFGGQGNNMYYIRSTNGGEIFSLPRVLLAETLFNSFSTRSVAVHRDRMFLAWQTCDTCDGLHNWQTIRQSTNAGLGFESYRLLFPGGGPMPGGVSIYDSVAALVNITRSLHHELKVSFDNGQIWVSKPFWDRAFQKLSLSGQDLHLIQLADTPSGEVAYRYSGDYGSTWGAEMVLSSVDNYRSGPEDARLRSDSSGRVFVAWRDGKYGSTNGFTASVLLRRSIDRGMTWEDEIRLTDIPSGIATGLSVDGGYVGVVWANESQPFRGISLRLSVDGGISWLSHAAVSDSLSSAGDPDVAVSANRVYVVWHAENIRSQIFFRRGAIVTTGITQDDVRLRSVPLLLPNHPNPFNSSTVLSYELPKRTYVRVVVYDILGREVTALVDGIEQDGLKQIVFNAMSASGIYIVKLETDSGALTQKILQLR